MTPREHVVAKIFGFINYLQESNLAAASRAGWFDAVWMM